jgi:hypothetical protein
LVSKGWVLGFLSATNYSVAYFAPTGLWPSVVAYAESSYEAVLRGLNRLVDAGWETDTDETVKQVEVEIHQEPTKHIVNVPKLLNWVKQDTSHPGQQTQKEKLRKLIGTR